MDTQTSNKLSIPAAIIVAGALIAVAVYASLNRNSAPTYTGNQAVSDIKVAPITESDYIKGNPNAPVVIVEYSDKECPFCKQFHMTMQSIMDQYGKDGSVAWVYRHFPIAGLHKKAFTEHEASECVNELAGPVAFWNFTDKIYTTTKSNDSLDLTLLPVFAQEVGANKSAFNTCLESGKYTAKIQQAVVAAVDAGAEGTPYSVMILKSKLSGQQEDAVLNYVLQTGISQYITIAKDKQKIILNGALPLEIVKALLDIVLK